MPCSSSVEEPPEHVKFIFRDNGTRASLELSSFPYASLFRLVPPDILEPYLQTLVR